MSATVHRPGLRSAVESTIRSRLGPEAVVGRVDTSLSEYSSSFRLESVRAEVRGGTTERFVLKDLSWETMLPGARGIRRRQRHDPRREIEVYRQVLPLGPSGPPRHLGDFLDEPAGDAWLFLEEVAGDQLCHVGEPEGWDAAVRWAGSFHRWAAQPRSLAAAVSAGLPVRLARWYRESAARARAAGDRQPDRRKGAQIDAVLSRHDAVVERLCAQPPTVVHGQLYPSNVIVSRDGEGWRSCVVDWETAAIGAAAIDLAALVEGDWEEGDRRRMLAAYAAASGDHRPLNELEVDVTCARLQLCLEMLGLPERFDPPPGHLRDWLATATRLVEDLG